MPIITINEVAWMGTTNSANDEWIELHNNTASIINFEGWVLKATDGTPEIKLEGTISANGFYLLERTDDSAVVNVNADQIYTGALNNKGERLELYDNFGNLIDFVDGSSGWPAGDNLTKQTMSRLGLSQWEASQGPGGTPKAQNTFAADTAESTPLPAPLLEKKDAPKPQSDNPQFNKELAAAGEPIRQTWGKQAPILLALIVALFSGIIIWVLKKKVK